MNDSATPAPQCYRHAGRETHIRCQRCERPICPDCMRSAAVGFQCPDCVKSGARETRAGRAAYGGARVASPALTSGILIALNAAVWLLLTATGGAGSRWYDWLVLRSSGLCAGPVGSNTWYPHADTAAQCPAAGHWLPGVADGAWWQLLTSTFTHVDIAHIGFNMLALWFLGPQLELLLGRARYLALYLLSGLAGSLAVYWLAPVHIATLGASGAVFGLMAALLIAAWRAGGDVRTILMWIGINAAITVFGRAAISWQGHLGGFLGGLALMGVFAFAPKGPRRAAYQWAGVATVALVLLAGFALRTAALA